MEDEEEESIRGRLWSDDANENMESSVIENRSLVFMRQKNTQQIEADKGEFDKVRRRIQDAEFRHKIKPTKDLLFRFSALTFNAHSIHLDTSYTQNVEGYPALLVHGPLTLTLLLTVLQSYLVESNRAIREIEYRNLCPLYVDEDLTICVYTYGSALETGSPRFSSPGDFFTYVLFVAFVIMITAGYFLSGVIFTSALILAFVYTFAQDNRGKRATFFIIQIPIEYLPWAMLVLTLVMAGWPAALSEGMGIIAAHLYDFLTRLYPTFGGGRNYLTTPAFVRRFFAAYAPRGEYRAYGTAYRPAGQNPPPSSSGWASSFQSSWGGRGPGRRLGGS
ncbi:hypothetical protein KXV64_000807 [Aspergillus fumigatus]|nr:hypothetical protein KXV64_000807 [Aspergillus fumigatus]